MVATLYGSFYKAANCCKLYISIRGHNKQPHKWPAKKEGEIWSWAITYVDSRGRGWLSMYIVNRRSSIGRGDGVGVTEN